jgi:hypothetical protein
LPKIKDLSPFPTTMGAIGGAFALLIFRERAKRDDGIEQRGDGHRASAGD